MAFNTIVLPSAIKDIQKIINYYDTRQKGYPKSLTTNSMIIF